MTESRRPKLDMSAPMMQDLPANFNTAVQIAGRNIDVEIDNVMRDYESYLEAQLTKFSEIDFAAKAKPDIDAALAEFNAGITGLTTMSASITKITDDLKAAAKKYKANDKTLAAEAKKLAKDAAALSAEIEKIEAKVGKLGSQLGTIAGTALRSAVGKVLP